MNSKPTLDRRQCLAAFAGAALTPFCFAQTARPPATKAPRRWPTVQKTLEGFVKDRKAAGAAVAVSYGGNPPTYPAAGTIAFDSATRFDENSICRIASITKNVTRTAAILLVEDGKLSLDQPVAEVVPEFRSLRVAIDIEKGLESRPAANTMTMRHLITNTSGLGSWTPASDSGDALHPLYRERGITPGSHGASRNRAGYAPKVRDLAEMVKRLAEIPLAYEPGTVLNYSVGFDVMGLVIERVSGKPYDVFLRERLFEPLDMRSSGFRIAPENRSRLTTNYDATAKGVASAPSTVANDSIPAGMSVSDAAATSDWLEQPTLLEGSGGLLSTARDFFRYNEMLRGGGTLAGVRVMKPETAQLVFADLRPPGIATPSQGVGAGTRAVLLTPLAPAGTFSSAGATGTLSWIDTARGGNVVFMVQVLWGDPINHPYARPLMAAIEQDLAG